MENNKITIAEAAKLMGVSQQFIRIGLQQGLFPFGCALKMSGGRYTYLIIRNKLLEYMGINV